MTAPLPADDLESRSRPLDVLADAKILPEGGWEQFYPLQSDPGLLAAGIHIGARVVLSYSQPPQLRIVFAAGDFESELACTEPLDGLPPDKDLACFSEVHSVPPSPKEIFFALNSYVAGIADRGIGTMFALAKDAAIQTSGFNDPMQQQVLNCLFDLAPAAAITLIQNAFKIVDWKAHPDLLEKLSSLEHAPPEILVAFLDCANPEDFEVRMKVVGLPPGVLSRLARDRDTNIRAVVAEHKNTPPALLARLAGDTRLTIQLRVAGNPSTPPEILMRMVPDHIDNAGVSLLEVLAKNPNTPPEILTWFAQSDEVWLQADVGNNPNLPLKALAYLAGDRSESNLYDESTYQRWLATPPADLARLAEDPSPQVRRAVASHRRITSAIFNRLGEDEDAGVLSDLLDNPDTPAAILERICERIDAGLVDDPEHCLESVLWNVTQHSHISPSTLARLGVCGDPSIREVVARNQKTPVDTLARLAGDNDPEVSSTAWGNPTFTNTSPETLAAFARSDNTSVRRAIAKHRRTPSGVLSNLAGDADAGVRQEVLRNQNTPVAVRAQFKQQAAAHRARVIDHAAHVITSVVGQMEGENLHLELQAIKLRTLLADPSFDEVKCGFKRFKELLHHLIAKGRLNFELDEERPHVWRLVKRVG